MNSTRLLTGLLEVKKKKGFFNLLISARAANQLAFDSVFENAVPATFHYGQILNRSFMMIIHSVIYFKKFIILFNKHQFIQTHMSFCIFRINLKVALTWENLLP